MISTFAPPKNTCLLPPQKHTDVGQLQGRRRVQKAQTPSGSGLHRRRMLSEGKVTLRWNGAVNWSRKTIVQARDPANMPPVMFERHWTVRGAICGR
eukprot:4518638-Prymnesium_polylepis.1